MLSEETRGGMTKERLFPREGRDSDRGGEAASGGRPSQALTVAGSAQPARVSALASPTPPPRHDKGQHWPQRANLISPEYSWDDNQCRTSVAICILQEERELFTSSLQSLGGVVGMTPSPVCGKKMLLGRAR